MPGNNPFGFLADAIRNLVGNNNATHGGSNTTAARPALREATRQQRTVQRIPSSTVQSTPATPSRFMTSQVQASQPTALPTQTSFDFGQTGSVGGGSVATPAESTRNKPLFENVNNAQAQGSQDQQSQSSQGEPSYNYKRSGDYDTLADVMNNLPGRVQSTGRYIEEGNASYSEKKDAGSNETTGTLTQKPVSGGAPPKRGIGRVYQQDGWTISEQQDAGSDETRTTYRQPTQGLKSAAQPVQDYASRNNRNLLGTTIGAMLGPSAQILGAMPTNRAYADEVASTPRGPGAMGMDSPDETIQPAGLGNIVHRYDENELTPDQQRGQALANLGQGNVNAIPASRPASDQSGRDEASANDSDRNGNKANRGVIQDYQEAGTRSGTTEEEAEREAPIETNEMSESKGWAAYLQEHPELVNDYADYMNFKLYGTPEQWYDWVTSSIAAPHYNIGDMDYDTFLNEWYNPNASRSVENVMQELGTDAFYEAMGYDPVIWDQLFNMAADLGYAYNMPLGLDIENPEDHEKLMQNQAAMAAYGALQNGDMHGLTLDDLNSIWNPLGLEIGTGSKDEGWRYDDGDNYLDVDPNLVSGGVYWDYNDFANYLDSLSDPQMLDYIFGASTLDENNWNNPNAYKGYGLPTAYTGQLLGSLGYGYRPYEE